MQKRQAVRHLIDKQFDLQRKNSRKLLIIECMIKNTDSRTINKQTIGQMIGSQTDIQ